MFKPPRTLEDSKPSDKMICRDLYFTRIPRQTRLSVRRVPKSRVLVPLGAWDLDFNFSFLCDRIYRNEMEVEEPSRNIVDPEVRAYVYSLVSAVS